MRRLFAILIACAMLAGLAVTAGADAARGTPSFGTNDAAWNAAPAIAVNDSTNPGQDDAASGVVRILWDDDFLYARVVVTDPDVFTGHTGSPWMDDNIEFFVGSGATGSNQYRIGAGGDISGNAPVDSKVTLTDDGYIVEAKFKALDNWGAGAKVTFEVQIGNSTGNGGDRFEVITAFGEPDAGYGSSNSFEDSITLLAGGGAAAGDAAGAAGSDKDGGDTGVASVAITLGLAAVAAAGVAVARKRK